MKKELADSISSPFIDELYNTGMKAGALGGKLLGAGGGGFMLFIAEPSTHETIRQALSRLITVSFRIGSLGSKIVIYEPEALEERQFASSSANGQLGEDRLGMWSDDNR